MGWITKDLASLLSFLVPGFIAAALFYSLTAHPKSSEFERVIEALIFTVVVRPFVTMYRETALFLGRFISLGKWTEEVELIWSIGAGVCLGLSLSIVSNRDLFHSMMRARGWSSQTAFPSEWFSALVRNKSWLVLHLKDQRRLFGWPEEWPDQSDRGHFLMDQPEWLLDDNERLPIYQTEKILINAVDVVMIEFVREERAPEITDEQLKYAKEQSMNLNSKKKEGSDGSESPATSPEPTG